MEYRRTSEKPNNIQKSVITLGKFDGLHQGHRKLISQVQKTGRKEGYQTVLFAFDVSRHMIWTKEERCRKIEQMGIDYFIECPLDEKLRHMHAEDFVEKILVSNFHAAHLVIGEDFRFGFERKGNARLLCEMGKTYGFQVDIIPKEMDGHRKISSTYVREQLNEGNMEKVNFLLGDTYSVTGEVLHGRGLGHRKLIPTTNLVPPREKLLPPNGVYITESEFENRQFRGITNISYKPTVGGESFLGVETYLFDCCEDLYGEKSEVRFLKFMRPERKFSSLEALKEELLRNAEQGRKYFDEM